MRKVTIHSDGTGPGTTVSVDGVMLPNVDEIVVRIRSSGLAQVTLVLHEVALDVDGQISLQFAGGADPKPTPPMGRRVVFTPDGGISEGDR